MKRFIISLVCFAVSAASCKKSSTETVTPGGPVITPVPVTTLTADCVPGSPGCNEIEVNGDPYYTLPGGGASGFNGYADPSIRKDPQGTGSFYLSYSYPAIKTLNGTTFVSISTHLAKSTDGGSSFNFVNEIWPSAVATNAANPAQQGYLESEVSNLLPVTENGVTTWYGAHINYLVYGTGSGTAIAGNSFQVKVAKASSPETLGSAAACTLTSAGTSPAWPANQNLSTLNSDLADCGSWNEPALYYENGTLYLTLVSFVYSAGGVPNLPRHAVHVFATNPTGAPSTWVWTYKGKLAGSAEANELGAQRLTQVDIARGVDGKLLMVCTPDDYNTTEGDYDHKGCKVLEIHSIDTPSLERDSNGKLIVRASISASDANDLGSAASTYDPASSTGIIFTRRTKDATHLIARIWATGLKP